MHARAHSSLPRPVRIAGIVVLCFVALLVVLVLFVALFDWNHARGFVARQAGSRLQREVRIDGPLTVKDFSRTPSIEVRGLWIGNPTWAGPQAMAQVPRLAATLSLGELLRTHLVFERIEVDSPALALQRNADGMANWEFDTRPGSGTSGTHLPIVRRFSLRSGTLDLSDAARELQIHGQLVADQDSSQGNAADGTEPFHLQGSGQINGAGFDLTVDGGPLINLRADRPYAFHGVMASGENRGEIQGELATPFDLGHFHATLQAQGRNLAKLYAVTGLALPRTSAYRISAAVKRDGDRFAIDDIVGRVGGSDVKGNANVRLRANQRPQLTAALASQSLRLADLGIAFGAEGGTTAGPGGATTDSTGSTGTAGASAGLLLPATELKLDRLGAMDADVDYRAQSVQTVKLPLEGVSLKLLLRDGVLRLEPAVFTLPLGRISGNLRVDSRASPAAVTADLRLSGVKLEQFKKKGAANAPLQGTLEGHATLSGRGNSAHAVAATASGRLTAVVPNGEIRDVLAELTGINVLRGLGLLLTRDENTARLRCGVAEFNVKDGMAQAGQMLFDTEHVRIEGRGIINLKDETLHLELSGKPKSLRLVRLRAPIELGGTLLKPAVGVQAGGALKQGGIAAALSAITPLAAVLAFVDQGLARDADCAALLADTDKPH